MKRFVCLLCILALPVYAGWEAPVTGTSTGGVFVWTNTFGAVSLGSVLAMGGSGAANTASVYVGNGAVTSYINVASAVGGTARLDLDAGKVRVYNGDVVRILSVVTGPVYHVLHNHTGE